MEEWKAVSIKGVVTSYEVSSEGRIRNKITRIKSGGLVEEKVLKASHKGGKTGYLQVGLATNGEHHTKLVHRVVAEAFLGPCPEGLEVNHKDGDKFNNRPENLEYITRQANLKHSIDNNLRKIFKGFPKGNVPWNADKTAEEDPRIHGVPGRQVSEETRKKLSDSLRGKDAWNAGLTAETDKRIPLGKTGPKKGTPSTNKGKTASEETRRRQSEAAKARHARMTPEERKDLAKAAHEASTGKEHPNKGKQIHSEESKKAISDGMKAYRQTL